MLAACVGKENGLAVAMRFFSMQFSRGLIITLLRSDLNKHDIVTAPPKRRTAQFRARASPHTSNIDAFVDALSVYRLPRRTHRSM